VKKLRVECAAGWRSFGTTRVKKIFDHRRIRVPPFWKLNRIGNRERENGLHAVSRLSQNLQIDYKVKTRRQLGWKARYKMAFDVFSRANRHRKVGRKSKNDTLRIGFFGRADPIKGIERIVEAAKRLHQCPDLELRIYAIAVSEVE